MAVSGRKYNLGKKHSKHKTKTTTPAPTKKHKSTTVKAEGEPSTQSSQPMESTKTTVIPTHTVITARLQI